MRPSAPGDRLSADPPVGPGGTLDRADRPPADAPGRPAVLGWDAVGGLSGVGPAIAGVGAGAVPGGPRRPALRLLRPVRRGHRLRHEDPALPSVGTDGRGALCRGDRADGRGGREDRRHLPGRSSIGSDRSGGPRAERVRSGSPGRICPPPDHQQSKLAGGPSGGLPHRPVRGHHRPPGHGGGLALRGQCGAARPARGRGGGTGRRSGRPRQGPLPGRGPQRAHRHPPAHRADLRALLPVPSGDGGVRLLHRQQGRGPLDRRSHPVLDLHGPGRPVRPQSAPASHRRPGAGPASPDRPAHRGAAAGHRRRRHAGGGPDAVGPGGPQTSKTAPGRAGPGCRLVPQVHGLAPGLVGAVGCQ